MKQTRQEVGRFGEEAVSSYLQNKGFVILARNWHAGRYGEIDIVAQKADELFIVEVKAKHWPCWLKPETMVNSSKLVKLKISAESFVLQHPNCPTQFSLLVAAVIFDQGGEIKEIKIFSV